MKSLYLNYTDGRVVPQLAKLKVKNPMLLYRQLIKSIQHLLGLSTDDFLGFAQNVTTGVIYSLLPILEKNKNFKILVSAHEIRWYKKLFARGVLPVEETTYPNYAGQKKIHFIKKSITVFDPRTFAARPDIFLSSKKPTMIIISHVSRLTGELLITPMLYRAIKKINKENIVVVDGSQAVGAISVKPHLISDIYIGLTSKFIGAEPHIAFYWVCSHVAVQYNIQPKSINPRLFSKEIYSAVHAMHNLKKRGINVSSIRRYLEKSFKKNHIPFLVLPNGQKHIFLIPVAKRSIPSTLKELEQKGIIISSNISYSMREPNHSCLRIAITPHLKKKDVDYVVKAFGLLKNGLG